MFSRAAVLDTFYGAGGNCFDTAFIYHDGYSDRFLGRWIERHNIRDGVIVIAKGAHTPNCDPVSMHNELSVSLERLGTDYVDIYMLHRDNPDVPVGEFVECSERGADGRTRAKRMALLTGVGLGCRAAITYARGSKGLTPLSAVNNHFSLAEMGEPPWEGCLDCTDPEFVEWLTVQHFPNFAWSSQARGFFVEGRVRPKEVLGQSMTIAIDAPGQKNLVGRRGVPSAVIALAYVLSQPFPSFAMVGSCTPDQVRDAWKAFDLWLSPSDLHWLKTGLRN